MPAFTKPLVSPEWLIAHLQDRDLVVLDARWDLAKGARRDAYQLSHIPGAQFVDLDRDLAGPPGANGRHPLPEPENFGAAMRAVGISAANRVVVYDECTGAAARSWWMLRAVGLSEVAVLEGGWQAWLAASGPTRGGDEAATAGGLTVTSFAGRVDADEVQRFLDEGLPVLDARSSERFRGVPNQLDPRPGHIPGATSLPWTEALPGCHPRSPQELRDLVGQRLGGAAPAAAYCGSGVTAAALILALETAGITGVKLYPGSYSEWALDPRRQVETELA